MNDSTKLMIKIAVVGLAAFLGYKYLQSSGLWAQWFGTTYDPTSPAGAQALLTYCQANPNGTVTIAIAGQQPTQATCANVIAKLTAPPPPPGGTVQAAPPPPVNTTVVAPPAYSSLQQQVLSLAGGPNVTLNADAWNYYWGQASGTPQTTDLFPANNRAALMTFSDYLAARAAKGLSGSMPYLVRKPMGWL